MPQPHRHVHLQDLGELETAESYFTRLLDYGASSKESAKGALREIRMLRAAGGGGGTPGGTGISGGGDDMGISPF
jgi:hypothetical protein